MGVGQRQYVRYSAMEGNSAHVDELSKVTRVGVSQGIDLKHWLKIVANGVHY